MRNEPVAGEIPIEQLEIFVHSGVSEKECAMVAPSNVEAALRIARRSTRPCVRLLAPVCDLTLAYLLSTRLPVLVRFPKGEPPRHACGTDARSQARDCTSLVNRRGRLFKTARERAD